MERVPGRFSKGWMIAEGWWRPFEPEGMLSPRVSPNTVWRGATVSLHLYSSWDEFCVTFHHFPRKLPCLSKWRIFFVIGQTLSSTTLCQHWEWFHKDCADSIFSRQFLITWFFVNLLYSNTIWSLFFHAGFCLFCRQNARNTPARSYSESHKQLKTSCLLFQNMLLVQVHGNTGVAARLSTYMVKISRTSYEREGFYTRSVI